MKRLFVAVPISEEVRGKIKQALAILSKTNADLKLVSLFNLHFTLKFLGEVDEEKIPELEEKLAEVARRTGRFGISLKGVGVFPSLDEIKVVWIGTEGSSLVLLMKYVGEELGYIRKNEYEEEVAHLTIARVRTVRNKKELQEFVKGFKNKEFGAMPVEKIILFESELTRDGYVYNVVREFGLTG